MFIGGGDSKLKQKKSNRVRVIMNCSQVPGLQKTSKILKCVRASDVYGNEIAPLQNSVSGCNGNEFDRRYRVAVRPGQALSGIRVVASSEGCRSGGERIHSSANLTWPKFFTAVQI